MKESRGFAHWFQKAHAFPFCSAGQASLIDLLVSKGAVVNATDYHGSTPLHLACQKGYQSVTVSSCALLKALQGWPLLCAMWDLGEPGVSGASPRVCWAKTVRCRLETSR